MTAVFEQYLKEINSAFLNGDATEHTHRPALKTFIEGLGKNITATNEPKRRTDCGMPDMKVSRVIRRSQQAFGYIECKDIGVDLKKEEKGEQLKRYLKAIDNLILTDYIHFRFYQNGELIETAVLAKEGKGGKFVTTEDSINEVKKLFSMFFASEPVTVKSAKELAERMAGIARLLRGVIDTTFEKESEHGALHGQYEAFKKVLLHDLKEDEFADMYAQTISYGLFAARCHLNDRTVWGHDTYAAHHGVDGKAGEFTREKAAYLLPKTNPFLRNIFGDIAGPGMDERIAWLVDDLVALLKNAAMDKVLKGFGQTTKRTDPVVHFYETFLAAYDAKLRESRGVYYTPEPVVSYIVRSVDWLLKEKFGVRKGLADNKKFDLPVSKGSSTTSCSAPTPQDSARNDTQGGTGQKVHRCLVLDPAAGTGTFLYEVIRQIRKKFRDTGAWNAYVKDHLLPRLYGFELMMAPYAICHMKLGLELAETGYDFSSGERLGVYLTNTLEEAEEISGLLGFSKYISDEAREANKVKRDLPIMVVLGNPPYSGHSANASEKVIHLEAGQKYTIKNRKGQFIQKTVGADGRKIKEKTFIGNLIQDYYEIDGKPLGEKNPKWLQDDYVKFIRYGQHRIEQTGSGILAFITNHGYLDNPTFRGMRQQLMQTFSEIYILDLHGNSKKKEVCPDGSADKNVFDIQQGVSIGIFVKTPSSLRDTPPSRGESFTEAKVYHAELWGERKEKYDWLNKNEIKNTDWNKANPNKPFYLLKPQDRDLAKEYQEFHKITDVMDINVLGFQTHRDNFAVDFNQDKIIERFSEMRSEKISTVEYAGKYGLKDNRDWQLETAREEIRKDKNWKGKITDCAYRPFDNRSCYFSTVAMDYPRRELLDHVAWKDNLCLLSSRQQGTLGYRHVLVSNSPANDCVISNRSREANQVFPLYLYPIEKKQGLFDDGGDWESGVDGRVPNLDKGFVDAVCEATGLSFVSDGRGDFLENQKSKIKKQNEGGGCAATGKNHGQDARATKSGRDARVPSFGPEDIFAWIYGVFHSPQYRARYAEFLKIDFPRVPLPKDAGQFADVCAVGHELVSLHLMEAEALEDGDLQPRFAVEGDMVVEKGYPKFEATAQDAKTPSPLRGTPPSQGESLKESPSAANSNRSLDSARDDSALGKVFINEKQYFEGVREDVWGFMIGGYQVCEKWLKDRRGRKLSYDDVEHYKKICVALSETIRLMADERLAIFK